MFVALVQEELIVDPESDDDLSSSFVKDPVSFDHIMIKYSFIHLSVRQLDVAFSMLGITFELALVV